MTTLLVIDDDEAVRRFLRTVLTGQGYTNRSSRPPAPSPRASTQSYEHDRTLLESRTPRR